LVFLIEKSNWEYKYLYNSGITTYAEVRENAAYENKTIVFLTPDDDELQMGSIIQLERDTEDQLQAYYNGSYYDMADDDIVWYFSNSTIAASKIQEQKPKLYYETEQQVAQGNTFTAQLYFRNDYDDETQWFISLFEKPLVITAAREYKAYFISNIAQLAQDHGGLEAITPMFSLGYLVDYELAQNPDRTSKWYFKIPKRLVEIEQIEEEEENSNKVKNKTIRNKSVKPKTKIIKTNLKDLINDNNQQQPNNEQKLVQIEQVPFTKAQRIKSKQIKTQIKYPEDEYDQFSASELFN